MSNQILTGPALWQTQGLNVFLEAVASNRVLGEKSLLRLYELVEVHFIQCDSGMLLIESNPGELVETRLHPPILGGFLRDEGK